MSVKQTNLYLKFNNYFKTDADIDDVIEKIKDLTEQSNRFIEKYKNFTVKNNTLFYMPLNLEVVRKTNIENIIKNEYKKTPAIGVTNFYKTIRMKYLNIKRSDVSNFIRNDITHQLMPSITHRINKPIVSKFPNELWCADLIDLSSYSSKNKHFNYILNIVDVFSRRIWVEKLKLKEAKTCLVALKKILVRAKVKPSYLITDNGGEFKEVFAQYCEENDIKQRFNRPHSPEANGIVERANKEVEKLIHSYFIKNGNNNWIDILGDIEINKNNTYTKAIKNKPINIWDSSKEAITQKPLPDYYFKNEIPQEQQQLRARKTILDDVKAKIAEFKSNELEVGDRVRIRLDALANNIKKMVKQGLKKKIIITYSPFVFTVVKKIIPRNGLLERCKYICAYDDKILLTKINGNPRQLYANVLLKVSSDTPDFVDDMSMADAIKLSGQNVTNNDASLIGRINNNN